MPERTRGWYWAKFPGTWVWYCPMRDMARSIDSGDTHWHAHLSEFYWGPWTEPPFVRPNPKV